MMDNILVGKWAFMLGLVIAIVVALIPEGIRMLHSTVNYAENIFTENISEFIGK